MKTEPTAAFEFITPEIAHALLAKNVSNRHLREQRVDTYAAQMRAGRWRLTHQGVAVGADGNLYDGQHRLSAITRANVTVRMLVVRGLEPQAREEIDTGEKRTAADNFSIVDGEAMSIQHAAILNALYRLTRDASLASRAVSVAELRASYKAFSEPLKALCAGRANSVKGVSRAYVLAAFVLAWRSNPETVTKALDDLLSGANLTDGDPILALRNRLFGRSRARTDIEDFKATLSAIEARVSGKQLARCFVRSPDLRGNRVFERYVKANPAVAA